MPQPLTAVEQKVYHYLLDFLAENTYQPSIREIGKKFRIKSTKTVSDLLQSLARKGYIERDSSRSRGVRLVGYQALGGVQPLPIRDAAAVSTNGLTPTPASATAFLSIDRRFLPCPDAFAIRARGDAMQGRAILDGDFVLVNPTAEARSGDMVVVRLGTETAVRMLQKDGSQVRLQSTTPGDPPRTIAPDEDFAILGTVCGVFRPMHDAGIATPVGDA